jgi:hypothetical protein
MNPKLVIDTEDVASIAIEGRGYAHRASRTDQHWRVAATLLFSAKTNAMRRSTAPSACGKGSSTQNNTRPATARFVQTTEQAGQPATDPTAWR